jgi:hypothetical protein
MRSSRAKTLLIAVMGMIYPWPANAAWDLDSMTDSKPDSIASFDSRQVNRALLRMVDRWNAHDIEGCLEAYWKSEDLVVVFDGQHFNGWQELPAYYLRDFHTPRRNGRSDSESCSNSDGAARFGFRSDLLDSQLSYL